MNKVDGIKISKENERLVKERLTLADNPYEFKIKGVTGNGYDLQTTAHITFKKLQKWAEREGAEVKLIQDKYEEIAEGSLKELEGLPTEYRLLKTRKHAQKGQSKGYLLIEITDPAASVIEKILADKD